MNRHRFDADSDPDPTVHFDADPDPDPTPGFTHVGKSKIFFLFTAVPVYMVFSFLSASHVSNFQYFGLSTVLNFSGERKV